MIEPSPRLLGSARFIPHMREHPQDDEDRVCSFGTEIGESFSELERNLQVLAVASQLVIEGHRYPARC
jgi:hypothetical protein